MDHSTVFLTYPIKVVTIVKIFTTKNIHLLIFLLKFALLCSDQKLCLHLGKFISKYVVEPTKSTDSTLTESTMETTVASIIASPEPRTQQAYT